MRVLFDVQRSGDCGSPRVAGATKADLEVVRADGTVASTNAIELTTAAGSVAAN